MNGQQGNQHRKQIKAVNLEKGIPPEEKPIYRVKHRKTDGGFKQV
jgi:hypothetical protein